MKRHLACLVILISLAGTAAHATDNHFRMACHMSADLFPDGRFREMHNGPPLTMIIEQEYTDRVHDGRTVYGEFLLDHLLIRRVDIDSHGIWATVRVTFDNDLGEENCMHGRSEAERERIVETILDRSRALDHDPSTARGSMLVEANFGPRSIPIPAIELGLGARHASSSFRLDGSILFSVMVTNPRPRWP